MLAGSLSHLSATSVGRGLAESSRRERAATAELLRYLAEFDARRLYRVHGLSSSYAYCVKVLGFSEDSACRRIDVARKGRLYPGIFRALADGSLHLTGAALLAEHLTTANADDLLAAAANRSKAGIEQLLAERFPRADPPTRARRRSPRRPARWRAGRCAARRRARGTSRARAPARSRARRCPAG